MRAKYMTGVAPREDGQTLVEYVLIIGFVAVLMVAALAALQGGVEDALNTVSSAL